MAYHLYFVLNLVPCNAQFIIFLQIHPEFGAVAEKSAQQQRGIGTDTATFEYYFINTPGRYAQFQCQPVLSGFKNSSFRISPG